MNSLTPEEKKAYDERENRRFLRQADKNKDLSFEEKERLWGEKRPITAEEKELEKKFEEVDEQKRIKENNSFKNIMLVISIISVILFFKGLVPFLIPVFLVLGWLYTL